jgi:hypothetical protein
MALRYILDNLDTVPAPLREHYAAHEGKFRLKVEGFDALASQWASRNETLATERDAALKSECDALIDGTLTAALVRAGANRTGLELVPEVFRKRVQLENVNGERVVRFFKDDTRTPRTGTGKNGAATWDDLMAEARIKYPSLFHD